MIEENIVALLACFGIEGETHEDWHRCSCPLAFARHKHGEDRNPSFGIFVNPTGKSGYSCFSCGLHGKDLSGLLHEMVYYSKDETFPDYDLAQAYKIVEAENETGYHSSDWLQAGKQAKKFEEWPAWYLDSFPSVFKWPEAVAYLNSRGVVPAVAKHFDVRFDAGKQTVCFPIRTKSKKLAGLRGRFLHPVNDFRYFDYKCNKVNNTSLVLFGEDHFDSLKPVVICEGMFDVSKVYRVYRNVVGNLTTSMSAGKIKKLKTAVEVIAFFDDDVAGVEAALTLKEHLKGDCAYRMVTYPPMPKGKDKQDPNELPLKTIASLLGKFIVLDKLIE